MNFFSLVHPNYRDTVRDQAAGLRDELSDAHYEIQILTKGGEVRWLDVTVGTFEHGRGLTALITAFDVTERKRTEEEMRRLAVSDPLTGLANYRRLRDAAQAEIERSKRTGRPFSLLLVDLDKLKQINDTYGHSFGNRAIARLADALRVESRAIDTPARFGGDEFAVVLPESLENGAAALAERVAKRLAEDTEQPAISFSYGVAACPQNGATMEALLTVADQGLYAMKASNRAAKRNPSAATYKPIDNLPPSAAHHSKGVTDTGSDRTKLSFSSVIADHQFGIPVSQPAFIGGSTSVYKL